MRWPDWELKLAGELADASGKVFLYGDHDCASFAAHCVHAITGVDFYEAYRGTYTNAIGAAKVIKKAGGLEGIAAKALGDTLPSPLLAQRGDVVLVLNEGNPALAVVMGTHAFAPGKDRLVAIPMNQWQKAWKVD